ncbi:hypothetical protein AAFN46_05400 [Pseudomonas sp. CAU 1711]|uniref:hypothetical protein n=1 Tax=Pseudomonas sp. CAU 1711 TaxID=3140356 RepID=UPI00326029AB
MRRTGLVLLLMVSLVLPSFAGMAFGMPAQHCPMQSQEPALADAPCCEHMDESSGMSAKKSCKSGLECKSGGLVQTSASKTLTPIPSRPAAAPSPAAIEREPAGFWRPPRFA